MFCDGKFDPKHSSVDQLPEGVELLSEADAIEQKEVQLKDALEDSDDAVHPFVALNTAFSSGWLRALFERRTARKVPVQVLFLASEASTNCATHPRHFLFLAEGAKAEVLECYASESAGFLNNVVSEVALEKGAELSICRIQAEGSGCSHLNYSKVNVGESARFESKVFSCGAGVSRNEIEVELSGKYAYCSLEGLYIGSENQCLDNRTVIDHQVEDGTSREFYKGILDDKARGAFSGKVLVESGAQRTDSEQNNRNLLLSDDAEADAKPQLEIYADDVKCSHGATVGQLDSDQIFYLRARGIGEAEARALLTAAFAMDLVEAVSRDDIRKILERQVSKKLAHEVGR
ncbi:MAG: Fe-S cluster assembly protein SufD [Bdellovibrionota bacterium]